MKNKSIYFKPSEFYCRCHRCRSRAFKKDRMHDDTISTLHSIRVKYGALFITSGYRCKIHNKAVGGVYNSYHTKGMAADFTPKDKKHLTSIYDDIVDGVFGKVSSGLYIKKRFIHIDCRENLSLWVG